ncbi:MAG: 2-phospho-L-lactate transferase CofD family protein, partial [Haliscomenobacter sp.]
DTVCYTLAGLANPTTGWGRKDESWEVLKNLKTLGAEDWFNIGDKDLATHIERTQKLNAGLPLSHITLEFCQQWKIKPIILPMTDQNVSTMVTTKEQGELAFQEYFVHQRCEPVVTGFRFEGIDAAFPAPGVLEALQKADAIIFCPSNPWVSIDPILGINGIKSSIKNKKILAVSPIIQGSAIKGPAAKMFLELGIIPSAYAVAEHYKELVTDFIIDELDHALSDNIQKLGMRTQILNTVMKSTADRIQLAQDVLNSI